tara:strand:- start:145 stop:537 length:393 start_codon:yes stop_codon:yes gene_type:complete
MSERLEVESSIAPPGLTCPRCDGLLPTGLGEMTCTLCEAKVKIDHPATRRAWRNEKVACPSCNKVLVCGVDERPALLQCGACEDEFILTAAVPKIEVACPACDRRLRMRRRPGRREITCPACDKRFAVNF